MLKKGIRLPDYSVLMSVYAKEKPLFLRQSIESILCQTFPSDDFVIVCDGELTDELNGILNEYERAYPAVKVVRLDENVGTGKCANLGISYCRHNYIAKMDSDDIALPDRCEESMYFLGKHPEIDMLGAYIEEFESNSGDFISVKKTPLTNKEIHKYAKRRNPFNNQTLVYRKAAVLSAGGYSDVKRCEDYEFVVRMLAGGAVGRNLDRVLVRYRVTEGNYDRRRNWANTKSFISVRWSIHKSGFSGLMDFIVPCLFQLFIFVMPKSLTGKIYKRFLRN